MATRSRRWHGLASSGRCGGAQAVGQVGTGQQVHQVASSRAHRRQAGRWPPGRGGGTGWPARGAAVALRPSARSAPASRCTRSPAAGRIGTRRADGHQVEAVASAGQLGALRWRRKGREGISGVAPASCPTKVTHCPRLSPSRGDSDSPCLERQHLRTLAGWPSRRPGRHRPAGAPGRQQPGGSAPGGPMATRSRRWHGLASSGRCGGAQAVNQDRATLHP